MRTGGDGLGSGTLGGRGSSSLDKLEELDGTGSSGGTGGLSLSEDELGMGGDKCQYQIPVDMRRYCGSGCVNMKWSLVSWGL
jgi:hypothetical protein